MGVCPGLRKILKMENTLGTLLCTYSKKQFGLYPNPLATRDFSRIEECLSEQIRALSLSSYWLKNFEEVIYQRTECKEIKLLHSSILTFQNDTPSFGECIFGKEYESFYPDHFLINVYRKTDTMTSENETKQVETLLIRLFLYSTRPDLNSIWSEYRCQLVPLQQDDELLVS